MVHSIGLKVKDARRKKRLTPRTCSAPFTTTSLFIDSEQNEDYIRITYFLGIKVAVNLHQHFQIISHYYRYIQK
jgi:hypothetical protein